jgi:ubiquitin carboxyl-terminal hydrolase 1
MRSVSQAGRRGLNTLAGSNLNSSKGNSECPPGLGNWDNSCYQNSILQSLAALKPLPPYLATFAADGATGPHRPNTKTVDTLRDLIGDLNDASNNGKTMWTPGILKNMSTLQQQDAQEYFSKLLDEMDKEIARVAKAVQKPTGLESDFGKDESTASQHSDDSGYQSLSNQSRVGSELKPTRNPLEGLAAQRVACTACGHSEGLSMIPFNCLTLSLGIDRNEHDLYERLDSYTKVESIPGVDCAKCTLLKYRNLLKVIIERSRKAGTKDEDFPEPFVRLQAIETALEEDDFEDKTLSKDCKILPQQRVSSTKTKQAVIARPPQSLAIHMNRSVFDESTGHMFKNLAAVRFPMTLDLGPWCLGSADGLTGQVSEKADAPVDEKAALAANDEEQWLLDPKASMVAGDLHPSKITGPIYELRAVITHYGRHENGHYVCYRKYPRALQKGNEKPPQLGTEHQTDDVDSLDGRDSAVENTPEAAAARELELEGLASQWWRLSDQDVTVSDEETVLAQGGVFMLFYDCVDPHSVMTSDVDAFVDAVAIQLDPAEPSAQGPAVDAEGEAEVGAQARDMPSLVVEETAVESADEVMDRARNAPLPAANVDDDDL